jgi:hypothetical protein
VNSESSIFSRFSPLSSRFPLFIIIFLAYGLMPFWFPLMPYFERSPLADVRTFTPSLWGALAYAFFLGLLFVLYWMALQWDTPISLPLILLSTILLALPLLQTFPINATDVYRYFIRGRVSSIYGENPFTEPPSAFTQDPFWQLAGEWSSETSPYGPVWEMAATTVTFLAQNNLYLGLLLFKLVGLLTHLLSALLIYLAMAGQAAAVRQRYTLLWAWNPALLLTFVVDAHNDGLMLVWLLLGWLLLQKGRPSLGFVIMLLAPLSKPIGLLPLPFFFLSIWQQLPDLRARGRFMGMTAVSAIFLLYLTFLPFGSPLALAARLLREAGSGGGFSLTVLLILLNQRLGWDLAFAVWQNVTRALAALGVLFVLWRTWHGRSPLRAAADVFALYIFQALNFRIWYAVWAIPWLILNAGDPGSKGEDETPVTDYPAGSGGAATSLMTDYRSPITDYRLRSGLFFLLTTQLSVLIYGHLRVYALAGDHLPAHLIGIPFTFGLPFLLARNGRYRSQHTP